MGGQRLRIVVIDDDNDDFLIVKDLLGATEAHRFEVRWVKGHDEALNELKSQTADLYLIDYNMGRFNGLELIEEAGPNLERPMILMTGLATRDLDVLAMEKGVFDFLPKGSLTADGLERAIRYAIRRAEDEKKLKLNERLKVERDAAEAVARSKAEFISAMSHEIRTPLGAIIGYSELGSEIADPNSKLASFLSIIHRNGQHLLSVVNEILDASRIEAGRIHLENNPHDWVQIVNEVLESLRIEANKKNLALSFTFSETAVHSIVTDGMRLRQILLNVIGNAVKFTSQGSISVTASESAAKRGRSMLSIRVRDTGPGMDSVDQEKLFTPFTEGKLTRTSGGAGLGLDISRKLARAMGGDIELIESAPGRGSTFEIQLPFEGSGGPDLTPLSLDKIEGRSFDIKDMRILVVDDSADNRDLIAYHLKKQGAVVTTACDGFEAASIAARFSFDVILMDLVLPGLTGMDSARMIRGIKPETRLVAVSGLGPGADMKGAQEMDFDGFLVKPVDRVALFSLLARLKKHAQLAP